MFPRPPANPSVVDVDRLVATGKLAAVLEMFKKQLRIWLPFPVFVWRVDVDLAGSDMMGPPIFIRHWPRQSSRDHNKPRMAQEFRLGFFALCVSFHSDSFIFFCASV